MIRIHDIAHHRNGVCGDPFYAVTFTDPNEGAMVGIVFSYMPKCDRETSPPFNSPFNCQVAVLSIGKLAEGNIRFGENSWRGDRYADALYKAIDQWAQARKDKQWN